MREFRVVKEFTDADGLHKVDSVVQRDVQTPEAQRDVDAMVRYEMLEPLTDLPAPTLTAEGALQKTRPLRRGKNKRQE
jgi:hypothetical protein